MDFYLAQSKSIMLNNLGDGTGGKKAYTVFDVVNAHRQAISTPNVFTPEFLK